MSDTEALVITYTTAPESYDWFGTRTLAIVGNTKGRSGKLVRKVEGPAGYAESQRARYASGLHMAIDEAEWSKLVGYGLVDRQGDPA